jgi:hypothetical protein
MPRKPLTPEERVRRQVKPLDVTFAELKAEIDSAGGDLRRAIKMKGQSGSLRLMIRCKKTNIPASWGMSLILDGSMIDCVHFHVTDYLNTDGFKRIGWHRDLMESGRNVGRKTLEDFDPKNLEDFIQRVLELFKVTLKPGGNDANG